MNDRNIAVQEILADALDIEDPGRRADFVSKRCGQDLPLRREVEDLLQASLCAGPFLPEEPGTSVGHLNASGKLVSSPVSSVVSSPQQAEKTGDSIGPYRLMEKVGEGGCGVVYLAQQEEPVRRQVALKVIKLGMDTKAVIARFDAERHALALMDHPNIARVLDAGATASGRPFFVMELVRGVKLTQYCQQNRLSTTDRLQLFIQVCLAVQHAHQKGVIHRDLKPSNILVTVHDEKPLPKVIDFGIAKATQGGLTDQTVVTACEQLLGTPAYMSPEQAAVSSVDIDTRSDIYTLGVLLYELLTGKTPFDHKSLVGSGLDQMRQTILHNEPLRPSTRLRTLVPGELDALAAQQRAEPMRLIHLLRGDLDWIVMKCLEKERSRRYQTANALAMDIGRYLQNEPVLARPPSEIYRLQKLVRRHKAPFAAAALVLVALLLGLASSTWLLIKERAARQFANLQTTKSEEVAQVLQEFLKGVAPSLAEGHETTLLLKILDGNAARIEGLRNQPEVQAELWRTLGSLYTQLGDHSNAVVVLQRALDLKTQLLSGRDDAAVARAMNDLCPVLLVRGKIQEAKALANRARDIQRKASPIDRSELANSYRNLGYVHRAEGDEVDASKAFVQALTLRTNTPGGDRLEVAQSLNDLALAEQAQGAWSNALSLYNQALAIQRELLDTNALEIATTLSYLAHLDLALSQPAAAESTIREALEIQKKALGSDNPRITESLVCLAGALGDQNDFSGAKERLLEAIQIRQRRYGTNDPGIAPVLDGLMDISLREPDLAEGERLLQEFLPADLGNRAEDVAALRVRGHFRAACGRWTEAAADFDRAIELQPRNHEHYYARAALYIQLGQSQAYAQLCDKIRLLFRDEPDPDIAHRMAKACLMLRSSGSDFSMESKWADTALDKDKSDKGDPDFFISKALAEYRRGRFGEAEQWARKALDAPDKRALFYLQARLVLALALQGLNDHDSARAAFTQALALTPDQVPSTATNGLAGGHPVWINWIIAQTLLKEAANSINQSPTASGAQSKFSN